MNEEELLLLFVDSGKKTSFRNNSFDSAIESVVWVDLSDRNYRLAGYHGS